MKFNQLLEDILTEAITTGPQLAAEIEKVIRKTYPKSFVRSQFSGGITESISVRFALGKDKGVWSGGYIENDPLHHLFMIHGGFSGKSPGERGPVDIFSKGTPGEGEEIVGKLRAELLIGGSLFVPGSGMGGKKVKVGWRKKSGDAATIVKHFDAYFKKLKKAETDNPDLVNY